MIEIISNFTSAVASIDNYKIHFKAQCSPQNDHLTVMQCGEHSKESFCTLKLQIFFIYYRSNLKETTMILKELRIVPIIRTGIATVFLLSAMTFIINAVKSWNSSPTVTSGKAEITFGHFKN